MSDEVPATILYDENGNPVGTLQDGAFYRLRVEAKIATVTNKEAYDIGTTTIYFGTAPQGTALSAGAWLIKKTTLVDGLPTLVQWSSLTAIWDNRASESYT